MAEKSIRNDVAKWMLDIDGLFAGEGTMYSDEQIASSASRNHDSFSKDAIEIRAQRVEASTAASRKYLAF